MSEHTEDVDLENQAPHNRARARSVHETREQEMRESEPVWDQYEGDWKPPSNLDAPPARPGFVQRWIRVGSQGKDDSTNTARRFREGWRPRRADTVAKDFPVPRVNQGTWSGCIMVEGMLLCELPRAMADKRRKFFAAKNRQMSEAIDRELAAAGTSKVPVIKGEKSTLVREVVADED